MITFSEAERSLFLPGFVVPLILYQKGLLIHLLGPLRNEIELLKVFDQPITGRILWFLTLFEVFLESLVQAHYSCVASSNIDLPQSDDARAAAATTAAVLSEDFIF